MVMLGRTRELGLLRSALDARRSSLVLVSGIRGGGKSSLVRHVLSDYPGLHHLCPPLPEPEQRAALATRVRAVDDNAGDADASWEELFSSILHRAEAAARPFVVALDDAHRLSEARSRFLDPMLRCLEEASTRDIALHVILVGPKTSLPGPEALRDRVSETATHLDVGPLPFRAAAELLPRREPTQKIRAYGVFGGIPRVLRKLDPAVTVGTNVRRLLLAPDGPLADAGSDWLDRDLQGPARYYAVLRTLAAGEADWGTVHEGVSDLTRSGQVAPYLKRLGELGLRARRSVDAKPGGRARRYAIRDPFLAFWLRFVLPHRLMARPDERSDGGGDHYARAIRPVIDQHMQSVFPIVCRQHMALDAIETLGAVAREGGSLWGPGYDLPVAGTLTSGAAYYGTCRWTPGGGGDDPLKEIEASLRETRYGFGRERRLRLLFTGRRPPIAVRRAFVRTQDAELIDAEALLG